MAQLSWHFKRTGYLATGIALVLAATAGLIGHQATTTTATDPSGITVTYTNPDRVGTTDDGLKYAPRPATEFRHHQCPRTPQDHAPQVPAHQLTVPDAQIQVPVGTSSDLSHLPDAPNTVHYDHSAPIGATHGKTIIAGHVDYAPGTRSARGGELSPFGKLHTVQPCTHVFAGDDDGPTHEYVVTDLYTAPQQQIEDTGIYATTGKPALVLVTCSGPSVGEIGTDIGFTYSHNLIVEAAPVEVAS